MEEKEKKYLEKEKKYLEYEALKKLFLNKYNFSLYYFATPLAFITALIFDKEFLFNLISFNLSGGEDRFSYLALSTMGWVFFTNLIFLVSLFSCIVSSLVTWVIDSLNESELKKITKHSHNNNDYGIIIYITKIFSLKLSTNLSFFFFGIVIFAIIGIVGSFIALIPWGLIINIIDFDYYGKAGTETALYVIKSIVILFGTGFIARQILEQGVDKLVVSYLTKLES